MNHYMDSDPYVIRERTSKCKGKCARCASRSGCERSADRAVRDWLPSPRGV
jgi:hypothetical protein